MIRTLSTRFTRLLGAAALALGLAAGNASATTFSAGTLTSAAYVNSQTLPVGSFLDTYNFSIGALPTALSSSVSIDLGGSGMPYFLHISGLVLKLYDSGNNLLGTSLTGSPTFLNATLATGAYYMTVGGTADGSSGGAYLFSIAAIPEPGQWLMLLAGVAMLGVMVRRRAAI